MDLKEAIAKRHTVRKFLDKRVQLTTIKIILLQRVDPAAD